MLRLRIKKIIPKGIPFFFFKRASTEATTLGAVARYRRLFTPFTLDSHQRDLSPVIQGKAGTPR